MKNKINDKQENVSHVHGKWETLLHSKDLLHVMNASKDKIDFHGIDK